MGRATVIAPGGAAEQQSILGRLDESLLLSRDWARATELVKKAVLVGLPLLRLLEALKELALAAAEEGVGLKTGIERACGVVLQKHHLGHQQAGAVGLRHQDRVVEPFGHKEPRLDEVRGDQHFQVGPAPTCTAPNGRSSGHTSRFPLRLPLALPPPSFPAIP